MSGEQLQASCHRNTRECRNLSHPRVSAIAFALSMALAGIGGLTMSQSAMAQATSATSQQQFSIPAGSLREALDILASRSGITVMYSPDLVAGKTTRGLSGSYTPTEALRHLLQGSGLEAQDAGDSTFTLRRTAAPVANPTGARQAGTRNPPTTTQSTEPETQDLEKVTVTGTRIRGGSTPSPVITIGSERIREEGFTDLGDVIRSIPQNFNGGQNPGVVTATGSGNIYNQNATGGSSLNLRGIGADATLTLLNGRRLAYGGFAQAVDISAIPVEAVERIEIVTDGASAIYGSDAVAGVGNVILKRDFDGLTLGAHYGAATAGGRNTREYNATAGTTWASGGLIATYKDVSTDPIHADQRDYTEHMNSPFVIYPGSELRSGLLSAYQSLGDRVELRVDALRTEREFTSYQNYSTFYYDNAHDTMTSLVAPGLEFLLPGDWSFSIGGAVGEDENIGTSWTVTTATGASILAANSCYCNESRSYEVGAEGPLFALRGDDARLAVGAGYRKNEFLHDNYFRGITAAQGGESSRFAYAELNLPLIGPDSNIPGVQRLSLTGAVRSEDYNSFGSVTTPKLGIIYGPSADYTLKASWGRSFKAPMLSERYGSQYAYLWTPGMVGGSGYPDDATVLIAWGGNRDLDPERARTATASLVVHPEALPGLEAELTWFDIEYTDRVVQPLTAVYTQSLSNPALTDFVTYSPTAEEQADLIATYSYGFYNGTGADYDPNNVVAIIWGQMVNVMQQRIKGVDLSGSYRFDLGAGRLMIRGSASWLDSSQQLSPGQSPYGLSGTLFYPAKINGRIGAVWTKARFAASVFANYIDGVTDTVNDEKTASFTTFDATLHYAIGGYGSAWSGFEFALSAQNLLDRTPPLYTPTSLEGWAASVPYDSTNYSAIGRYLSISVSKHW